MRLTTFTRSLANPEAFYLLKPGGSLRRRVRQAVIHHLPESTRSFDWSVRDLGDKEEVDLVREREIALVSAARTLPWMNAYRWIYVLNAHRGGEVLTGYLKSPSPRTVMILEVAERRPPQWPKMTVLEPADDSEQTDWIKQRLQAEGYTIDQGALRELKKRLGEGSAHLESELEKLLALAYQSQRIDRKLVTSSVAAPSEKNVFALTGALAGGQPAKAVMVLNKLFDAGINPGQILGLLHWNLSRLLVAREMLEERVAFNQILRRLRIWSFKSWERELRSIPRRRFIDLLIQLRKVDRQFKTTGTNERHLLERLVIDTCLRTSV